MDHIDAQVPPSLLAALRRDPTEIAGELRMWLSDNVIDDAPLAVRAGGSI